MTDQDAKVLAELAAIKERLEAGDKRFDEFSKHVAECTEEKRKLLKEVATLVGGMGTTHKLLVGQMALMGSGIVAVAIVLT